MIGEGVIVKEGVSIPAGSICSLLTYDSDKKDFREADTKTDMFVKGNIAYMPRDMQLKEGE